MLWQRDKKCDKITMVLKKNMIVKKNYDFIFIFYFSSKSDLWDAAELTGNK